VTLPSHQTLCASRRTPHTSGRDSLPSSGSYHLTTRLTERFYLSARLLPSLVDQVIKGR
jgi:hypothetical protein